MINKKAKSIVTATFITVFQVFASPEVPSGRLELAQSFLDTGNGSAAALELRRMSALESDQSAQIQLLLYAAEAYRQDCDYVRMDKMLSKVSEADWQVEKSPEYCYLKMLLLEAIGSRHNAAIWGEALFNAATEVQNAPLSALASRISAADYLLAEKPDRAVAIASRADESTRLQIETELSEYRRRTVKSPRVGGLLGLIPGMGYAYSGEWGNAVRSIVLNSLFIWAMRETAYHDEWALFGVSTFFELTWYSGSIYGGIDAAHRYNKRALETAVERIRGSEEPVLRYNPTLKLLKLDFGF